MKRKSIRRLLCIMLTGAMLLAGCGSSETGGNKESTPTAAEASAAAESAAADAENSGTAEVSGKGPIVDEKVTYTLACQLSPNWGNPADGEFWQKLEEETNVHIEWVTYLETEADEKFKLLMASGDYPDGFIGALGGSDNDIVTYGSEGIYIPLNDLIDQYCPNFKRRVSEEYPDLMKMITCADGNIYGMPSVLYNPDIYNNTFINKKWLDAVGADVPTTTEEFEEVLKKFKEEDPNGNGEADEIPMTFMFSDWGASDHGPYFGAFGYPLSPDYIMIDNKEVKYLGAQESFKKGAEWLGKLYGEGLVDRDIFTQDSSGMTAKVSQGTVGVFSSWDSTDAGDYADEYVALMPLKGPDGEQNALVEGITGFYKGRFMITDKAKNPEILMQWIDRFYESMETGLNATYGIGPDKEKAWYYDDNNNIIFKKDAELPEDQIRGQQQLPFAPAILGTGVEDFLGNPAKNEINAQMKQYAGKFEDGTWERWPSCYMTVEEKEDIATTETDLQDYSKNQLAKWIAGESDVNADWDNYLKELESVGLSHYLEVKQQIFDRYDSAE
ncbi:extracellular solute-binding protein [Eisenbergiella sp.]